VINPNFERKLELCFPITISLKIRHCNGLLYAGRYIHCTSYLDSTYCRQDQTILITAVSCSGAYTHIQCMQSYMHIHKDTRIILYIYCRVQGDDVTVYSLRIIYTYYCNICMYVYVYKIYSRMLF